MAALASVIEIMPSGCPATTSGITPHAQWLARDASRRRPAIKEQLSAPLIARLRSSEVAGGFMTLINTGTEPDRLIGGSTASAGKFEIHESAMEGGVMKMRPLPKGIEIKPGQTVEFKPGSYHLMFVGLKEPFEKGKRVKGTLQFEKAGTVEVEYAVEAAGGMPGMNHDEHKGH